MTCRSNSHQSYTHHLFLIGIKAAWLYARMLVAEDEPDLFEVYKLDLGQFLTRSCSLLHPQ